MNRETTPTAGVILIGNELLSGRTQDKNLPVFIQKLATKNIKVREVAIIPDIEQRIIATVRRFREMYTYTFTTGGIGATHDDITAASIAKAFNTGYVMHSEALQILQAYYGENLNETRKKMAKMPEGATLIPNPVSGAPGFQIESVFALAGVPMIMQAMLQSILPRLHTGASLFSKTLITDLKEGQVAQSLAHIQDMYPQLEIGSYPHFSLDNLSLSIVVSGIQETALEEAVKKIEETLRSQGGHILKNW